MKTAELRKKDKKELEKNVKAALNATFARMDLVTREEFDVQTALLGKTRELLQSLEVKVNDLEKKLAASNKTGTSDN